MSHELNRYVVAMDTDAGVKERTVEAPTALAAQLEAAKALHAEGFTGLGRSHVCNRDDEFDTLGEPL